MADQRGSKGDEERTWRVRKCALSRLIERGVVLSVPSSTPKEAVVHLSTRTGEAFVVSFVANKKVVAQVTIKEAKLLKCVDQRHEVLAIKGVVFAVHKLMRLFMSLAQSDKGSFEVHSSVGVLSAPPSAPASRERALSSPSSPSLSGLGGGDNLPHPLPSSSPYTLAHLFVHLAKEQPEEVAPAHGVAPSIPPSTLDGFLDAFQTHPPHALWEVEEKDRQVNGTRGMQLANGQKYEVRFFSPAVFFTLCVMANRDSNRDMASIARGFIHVAQMLQGNKRYGHVLMTSDGALLVRVLSHFQADELCTILNAYRDELENDSTPLLPLLPQLLGMYEVLVPGHPKFTFLVLVNSDVLHPASPAQWRTLRAIVDDKEKPMVPTFLPGLCSCVFGVSPATLLATLYSLGQSPAPALPTAHFPPRFRGHSVSASVLREEGEAARGGAPLPPKRNRSVWQRARGMSEAIKKRGDVPVQESKVEAMNIALTITELASPESLEPRMGHTATRLGNTVFLVGGINASNAFVQAVDMLTLADNAVECVRLPPTANCPRGLHGHTTVGHDPTATLFVFGGGNALGVTNAVLAFDVGTLLWREVATLGLPPTPRSGHAAAMAGSVMVVFGGLAEDGYCDDIHVLRIPQRLQSQRCEWYLPHVTYACPRPAPRANHSLTALDDNLLVAIGGTVPGRASGGEVLQLRIGHDHSVEVQGGLEVQEHLKSLCNHAACLVSFAPAIASSPSSPSHKGVLVTGGDVLGQNPTQVHFVDGAKRAVGVRAVGTTLPPVAHHAMARTGNGEEVVVVGGVLEAKVCSRVFRLQLTEVPKPKMRQFMDRGDRAGLDSHIESFVLMFTAAPPPVDARVKVYQTFMEDTVRKYEHETTGEAVVEDAVSYVHMYTEKLLIGALHDLLWESCGGNDVARQDVVLSAKCARLSQFLTPQHLDFVPPKPEVVPWMPAQTALRFIADSRTPMEKIGHLMRCCVFIHSSLAFPAGADDFLPVLVYVVICANVPNLHHHLSFMNACAPQPLTSGGEEAYYLTQLSCAVMFITTLTHTSLKIDQHLFEEQMQGVEGMPADDEYDDMGAWSRQLCRATPASAEQGEEEWWGAWLTAPEQSQAVQPSELNPANAHYSGTLEKQGFYNRAWKSRVFRLFDNVLAYYESREDSAPKGLIYLDGAMLREFTGNDSGLEVCVPGRIFKLRAPDEATARTWARHIQQYSSCQRLVIKDAQAPKGGAQSHGNNNDNRGSGSIFSLLSGFRHAEADAAGS